MNTKCIIEMRPLLFTSLLCVISLATYAQSASYDKTVVSSSCWSENPVIATSTQQNAIAVYENFVYMAFYNTDRKLSIARNMNFGEGSEWVIIELPHVYEKRNGVYDNHNTPNIAISPNDGRIHLAFDMHARNLRYIISDESAATVSDAEFNAGLFSTTRDYLESGRIALPKVTYPRFFLGDNDNLFFMYRTGGSGNGDTYMAQYKGDGFWNKPFEIIDGNVGSHDGSDDRCAYFNDVHFKDGKIYLTWVWRETPDAETNHDLMFAYSDDNGQSWKSSSGATISGVMNLDSRGIKVASIPTGAGMTNHHGCTVDGHGNVHVVLRIDGSYIHYFGVRNGGVFKWSESPVASFSGDRPKFYCDQNTNDLYFLTRQGSNLRMFATPTNGEKWNQWSEIGTISDRFMTSTNSFMNASGNLLTSMAISTDNRMQVIRWSLTTSSPEIEEKEEVVVAGVVLEDGLRVYPNPSISGIYSLSREVNYTVNNMEGVWVTEGRDTEINLKGFSKGLYILRVNDQVIKLVRE